MKRQSKMLRASGLFLITAIVLLAAFVAPMLAFSVIGGGVALAAAVGGGVVEGTVTTDKVAASQPDLHLDHISQKITEMKPAATPLDTIMRSVVKKVPIKSFRTDFYSVDIKPLNDKTAAAYTKPTDGDVYAAITVDNITIWNVDDTVLVPGVAGVDGKPFVGCISKKDSSTGRIYIQPLNGPNGTNANAEKMIIPSIPDDAILVRMASAKSELDAQTSPFAVMPAKEFNYCQNYMAQVDESTFQRIHDQEVDWGFSNYEELNIYDMRARAEMTYLFGFRNKIIDAEDNEEKYTSHGLIRYMTKQLEYSVSSAINDAKWIAWTKSMFEDNAGSDHRFVFAGDDLLANISGNVTSVQKQIDAKNVEVKWGITFNKVETNFGILYIRRHPLLRLMGMSAEGIVVDINNIEKHIFQPLSVTKLELKKSGQRNADANVLQEVNAPVLRYPGTHARIVTA